MWFPAATAPFVVTAIVVELTVLVPPAAWSALTNATATPYSSYSMRQPPFGVPVETVIRTVINFPAVDAVTMPVTSRPSGNCRIGGLIGSGIFQCRAITEYVVGSTV